MPIQTIHQPKDPTTLFPGLGIGHGLAFLVLLQEHRGLAQGDTEAEHCSSALLNLRARESLIALLHHMLQSDLKSPPETAIDRRMKVSTSSTTPAGSFVSVIVGTVDEAGKRS